MNFLKKFIFLIKKFNWANRLHHRCRRHLCFTLYYIKDLNKPNIRERIIIYGDNFHEVYVRKDVTQYMKIYLREFNINKIIE